MNLYKILTFDGCNSNEFLVYSFDIIQAIQNSGIIYQQVIRVELIGSQNQQNI